jgi:hypothetical protein
MVVLHFAGDPPATTVRIRGIRAPGQKVLRAGMTRERDVNGVIESGVIESGVI